MNLRQYLLSSNRYRLADSQYVSRLRRARDKVGGSIPFIREHPSSLCGQTKPLFALSQCFLRPYSLRDVPNNNGKKLLSGRFNLRNGSLYRKFFASGSQSPQCAQTIQCTIGDPTLGKATNMHTMFSAEAFRDEAFDGTSNRFNRTTEKYSFCSGIEEHDPLSVIDGDDRVHRRADDARQ